MKWPIWRWNVQKMRSESSEYVRINIALKSYFEEHAKEVWENLDETKDAEHVVEHVSTKIDCNGFEGT